MSLFELFDKKLGFGAMRLPEIDGEIDKAQVTKMIDSFIAAGFKYFDTAYPYHGGRSEGVLKECLVRRHPRSSFFLADKMPVWDVKESRDYERIFNEQLSRCGVEYFDFYLLHALDRGRYKATTDLGGFEFVKGLKETGKARCVGFSFHDKPEVLDKILSEHPELDFVQLQINYLDWKSPDVQSERLYETATAHNKPIIIMEPVKGGNLASLPPEAGKYIDSLNSHMSYASYAIRYAASLPNVMMVLSGMSDMSQAADNIEYMKSFLPLSREERQAVENAARVLGMADTVPCTACKYCVDDCPKHIPIPNIFKLYNAIRTDGVLDKSAYAAAVSGKGKAGECVKCGKCEGHCPQHIEIRKQLEKAASVFEA